MGSLEGRVAVITGGGRGIGLGIASVLARDGASVVLADIDEPNALRAVEQLRAAGGAARFVHCDVTSEESAIAAIRAATEAFGGIDILVNNAGVIGRHAGGGSITLDDFDWCYEVNLKGVWIMARSALPALRSRGTGRIINIASIAGRRGDAGMAHYNASKAGAISLTQSLAKDLGRYNITVNAVCPGLLWTDMWRTLEALFMRDDTPEVVDRRATFERYIQQNCPLGREQTPEDIGNAVAFFASDRAANITGQALNVDGGMVMN